MAASSPPVAARGTALVFQRRSGFDGASFLGMPAGGKTPYSWGMSKSERLDLRLTAEQKATIEQAASLEGTTAAGFTVAAVMERASQAIYRAKSLSLAGEAWDEFIAILDSRPEVPEPIVNLLGTPSVLEQ